jgi:hypothetical protein
VRLVQQIAVDGSPLAELLDRVANTPCLEGDVKCSILQCRWEFRLPDLVGVGRREMLERGVQLSQQIQRLATLSLPVIEFGRPK